jgi:hypothetical protein
MFRMIWQTHRPSGLTTAFPEQWCLLWKKISSYQTFFLSFILLAHIWSIVEEHWEYIRYCFSIYLYTSEVSKVLFIVQLQQVIVGQITVKQFLCKSKENGAMLKFYYERLRVFLGFLKRLGYPFPHRKSNVEHRNWRRHSLVSYSIVNCTLNEIL